MGSATDVLLRGKKRKAREWLAADRAAEARALLEPVCARYPRDPEVWCLLGQAQGQTGAWAEAHGSLRRAADLAPADPAVWFFLGNALLALGRSGEAVPVYQRALERNPRWPQALSNLGRALQLESRDAEAIDCFERALALDPKLTKTLYNLGLSHRRYGKPLEAIDCFQRVLVLHDTPEVRRVLGRTFVDIGDLDGGIRCFETALQVQPKEPELWCDLGNAYRLQGGFELSLEAYRRAQTVAPEDVDARAGEATTLEMLGKAEEAYRIVRELLERGARTAGTLATFASLCRRFDSCAEAMGLIGERLGDPDLSIEDRALLLFRLGRLHAARGEYESAFAAYAKGNDLVHMQFDRNEHTEFVDAIIECFSVDAFAGLSRSSRTEGGPIFIVGMPRSGTSLTEQILASHTQVFGAGELPLIPRLANSLGHRLGVRDPYPQCVRALRVGQLDQFAEEYLCKSRGHANGARYVTDKLPANFLYLGLIALLFPGARVVHCARDPRDTGLSIYFQIFGPRMPFAHRLGDIGYFYRKYTRLMDHWERVLPLPIHTVRYEDLVQQPEPTIRGLLAFLGLVWEARCLEPHRSDRVIATASYDQVRHPINTRSVGRWRHYERYLGDLLAALGGPARGSD